MATKPGVRLPAAERSEQLLDVAEKLFVTKGFDQTSMADVANAAGVTRPVVYEHHGSKAGLYLAIMERARRSLAAAYAEATAGLDQPRDLLRAAGGVWFSIVERDPSLWTLLYGGGAEPLTGELGEELARIQHANLDLYVTAIGGWLGPSASRDDVSLAVHVVFGVAYSIANWWIANQHMPIDEVVERFTDLAWAVLVPMLDDRT